MTSIPVHASTLRLLQLSKTGDETWDELLLSTIPRVRPPRFRLTEADRKELDAGHVSPRVAQELARRKNEPRIRAEDLYRELGLRP